MAASAKRQGQGIATKPPAKQQPKPQGKRQQKEQQLPNLTKQQNQIINQRQQGDLALGDTANKQLEQVNQNYSQPFDWGSMPQMPQGPDYSQLPKRPDMPDWGSMPGMGRPTDFSGAPSLKYTDVNALPQGPVTGDFNQWRQQQIDATTDVFDKRFAPVFKQQMNDFEQDMANRGIPVGSDLYNRQKKALQDQQDEQRQSNVAQAMAQAGTNASQFADVGFRNVGQAMDKGNMAFGQSFSGRGQYGQEGAQSFGEGQQLHATGMTDAQLKFNMGNQAYDNAWSDQMDRYNTGYQVRQNAISDAMQRRGQPLADYNALTAGRSPYETSNLAYSQNRALQEDQQAQDRWMLQHTPRGGGGGGGGGNPPTWAQYGFSSPMEYDAYQDQRAQANQLWNWQHNPQNQKPSTPGYGASMAGGILGTGLGLLGMYGATHW